MNPAEYRHRGMGIRENHNIVALVGTLQIVYFLISDMISPLTHLLLKCIV